MFEAEPLLLQLPTAHGDGRCVGDGCPLVGGWYGMTGHFDSFQKSIHDRLIVANDCITNITNIRQ